MSQSISQIQAIISQLQGTNHRRGFYLQADYVGVDAFVQSCIAQYNDPNVAYLGGKVSQNAPCIPYKKGEQLLGQELDVLVVDMVDGFDANSFTAALGAIVGGGVLIVKPWKPDPNNFADVWLERCLHKLVLVSHSNFDSEFCEHTPQTKALPAPFNEQQSAVQAIVKVSEGHRKRPLVLTADRGRGKSSALGIAAAELMSKRCINIAVTAPLQKSVQPVFQHAERVLERVLGRVLNAACHAKGELHFEASSLKFIAPDELLRTQESFDLVLVDEAAAIPLPLLQTMASKFHRIVFSSTVHGYEGSGRGFTLKFLAWLREYRSGMREIHLTQPIRWAKQDPLEAWVFDSFLLDAELDRVELDNHRQDMRLVKHHKSDLIADSQRLKEAFALLVSAHYQTSPNDLFGLLSDSNTHLYSLVSGKQIVGCMLTVEEGRLSETLISDIALGKRRPKGQLVVSSLINHLGVSNAATHRSERIMRIAVHPDWQGNGFGGVMLDKLSRVTDASFISTSFGMTPELVTFWLQNGFTPVKLGSQRDSSSGSYSLIMVKELVGCEVVTNSFARHLPHWLIDKGELLSPQLVRVLLPGTSDSLSTTDLNLLERFTLGGSNVESTSFLIHDLIFSLSQSQLKSCSDFLLSFVLCRMSVEQCCNHYALTGRKQLENRLRVDVATILESL
ncbi:GNAT family N-acetyltransferase [Vibrio astriarenae]|uniref:tRNA(Met) cytidine acetyltransferase TmcA n=1 Tax=Vibrio astriarenae TaxID=1481923 RepID=A0A7Z2T819_9VIBR|nr:GNAT family N-acetyltransferase [Vibrio astriarenae]QIA65936.1 GNAT family N-acetyltransferase [Vibrio astriarenae]